MNENFIVLPDVFQVKMALKLSAVERKLQYVLGNNHAFCSSASYKLYLLLIEKKLSIAVQILNEGI